jgi:uncharacterized membrane protein YkvA (DUF1232 family)
MNIINRIADWVATPYTVYQIIRDPAITRSAKICSIIGLILIFAYMISPVDLIPEFVPMAGFFDDLLVVPIGLSLMRKFIPDIGIMEKKERIHSSVKKIVVWTAISLTIVIILGLIWLGLAIFIIVKLVSG